MLELILTLNNYQQLAKPKQYSKGTKGSRISNVKQFKREQRIHIPWQNNKQNQILRTEPNVSTCTSNKQVSVYLYS